MNNWKVLVTGGTGFVAVHTILQLLQQGYKVNTTVRSLSRKQETLNALREGGIHNFDHLTFFEADLLYDNGWETAMKGCDYVLHVASPFVAEEPEDENALIVPAREGALRALRFAKQEGVKRVVLTSSFAAIGYTINPRDHVFTEEDWTDENAAIAAYIKSKTIAEKAAWNYITNDGGSLELTVINPVGIFGPVIGGVSSASLDSVVKGIINGNITETVPFTFGVVDVRDVADIHIKAMISPLAAGQRFLATTGEAMSFCDVAELVRQQRPQLAARIRPLQPLPKESYIVLSNRKAVETLNWQPEVERKQFWQVQTASVCPPVNKLLIFKNIGYPAF